MTQQEKENKLFEIFSNIADNDIKFKYDEILHKVLIALDTKFIPNLSGDQSTKKSTSHLYNKERGELYNNVVEMSLNYSTIAILSKIPHKTSIQFDVLFPSLIDFRTAIKNEMSYLRLNKFRYTAYKDMHEKFDVTQRNVKMFINYFWGNIEKSIFIASDVNLKEYVYDTMTSIHKDVNALYGNDVIATDYDTFYIRKGNRYLNDIVDAFSKFGFKLHIEEWKTFGITPSGDFIKFNELIDSVECNEMTLRVK